MVSYLGSLVQFSPATGRAGLCRQIPLCVGSTPRVPATLGLPHTGVSVLSPSTVLRVLAALHGAGPALSSVPVFGSSITAQIWLPLRVVSSPASVVQAAKGLRAFSRAPRAFSLRGERLRQPKVLVASPQVRHAFSLRDPSARRLSGLRKSLDGHRGPRCWVGGGGFSGAEFSPFPSSLPPTSSGDGAALLCSFSVPLFCEPPAVCSVRLIFPCSPTV